MELSIGTAWELLQAMWRLLRFFVGAQLLSLSNGGYIGATLGTHLVSIWAISLLPGNCLKAAW